MFVTLKPAYGRDYTSEAAVRKDWEAGKDFRVDTLFHPYDGALINKQDADGTQDSFSVRYNKNREKTRPL